MTRAPRADRALLWRSLWRNLVAGTRMALFLRTSPYDFRFSAGQYAMVALASVLTWALGGLLRNGLGASFDPAALPTGLAQLPLVLLACLLAAHVLRLPAIALPLAIAITATDPVFELGAVIVHHLGYAQTLPAWLTAIAPWVNLAFIGWAFAVLGRAQWLFAGWRGARSVGAYATFCALLLFFIGFMPRAELWGHGQAPEPAARWPGPVREDLFHRQGQLLAEKLAALEPQRPGTEDLYFLGVAPYAQQDTFMKELGSVRRLMESRFDLAGRALSLVNHASTLAREPIASVTQLRAALDGMAKVMDVNEDVLFLFLTTHGTDRHELEFSLPPLELSQLNPTMLARMLADSGIRWKVIVISACYSGGFIEPLRDENTLIITSANATQPSFGCEVDSDYTWFSRAFFDQALREQALEGRFSIEEAFGNAQEAVAARERAEGYEPSRPQIHVGGAIRAKLESLSRRLGNP